MTAPRNRRNHVKGYDSLTEPEQAIAREKTQRWLLDRLRQETLGDIAHEEPPAELEPVVEAFNKAVEKIAKQRSYLIGEAEQEAVRL